MDVVIIVLSILASIMVLGIILTVCIVNWFNRRFDELERMKELEDKE